MNTKLITTKSVKRMSMSIFGVKMSGNCLLVSLKVSGMKVYPFKHFCLFFVHLLILAPMQKLPCSIIWCFPVFKSIDFRNNFNIDLLIFFSTAKKSEIYDDDDFWKVHFLDQAQLYTVLLTTYVKDFLESFELANDN